MPKAIGEAEIVAAVRATIAEMGSPTMKDMGTVMKNTDGKVGGRSRGWQSRERSGEEGAGR